MKLCIFNFFDLDSITGLDLLSKVVQNNKYKSTLETYRYIGARKD